MTKTKPKLTRSQRQKLIPKRNLTPEEAMQLQEIHRLSSGHAWMYNVMKGNTALIPRGKEVAEEYEAIARILDQAKRDWVAAKLIECGYTKDTLCDINLSTGEIYSKFVYTQPVDVPTTNEPRDTTEA